MNTARKCLVGLFATLLLVSLVRADEKVADKNATKNARFDRIKSLSGEWEVTKGGEHAGGTVSYKVTAGGSAVLETLFGGTDHEMVTLYYLEGDDLVLRHYCMLGNQPHMRAEPQADKNTLVFKCDHKGNKTIASEDHMHQATFKFVDADRLQTDWVLYKDGKADSTHGFELKRKK